MVHTKSATLGPRHEAPGFREKEHHDRRERKVITFLEVLEPLLLAAQKYAEITELRGQLPFDRGSIVVLEQKEAADALLNAAIEFAKWGK